MRNLILERFINIFDSEKKKEYVDEVWNLIQTTYQKIGGIKGSGFESKEDMIKKIPFWKLAKKDGKIVAVSLYKDKNGRKRVASATDGTEEGKNQLEILGREDLTKERGYAEVSSSSLNFMRRRWKGVRPFEDYIIPPENAEKILGDTLLYPVSDDDPEVQRHPDIKKYFYRRNIGGHYHTKIMVGTPSKKIQ